MKHSDEVGYFDGYGNLSPPVEVVKYFQSDGSVPNIRYIYEVIQKFNYTNVDINVVYSYIIIMHKKNRHLLINSDCVEMSLTYTSTGSSSIFDNHFNPPI